MVTFIANQNNKASAKSQAKNEIVCISCGNTKISEFYSSLNENHKMTNGKLPWCKSCVEKQYGEYLNKYGDGNLAMYYTCRKFDIYFSNSAYDGAKNNSIKTGWTVIQSYFKQINSFRNEYGVSKNGYGVCFDESSDFLDIQMLENNQINNKNNNLQNSLDEDKNPKKKKVSLTNEDKKSQEDVKKLLGYDPFSEYEMEDRIFLCNDLVSYLDEDTVEDGFKCSVVLQIVNNNNQIRKIDIVINQLSSSIELISKNSKSIDELTSIKIKLNQANDKLSKENNIALKYRDGNGTQNNSLGSMMKKLRELDFEKAEHDYYDMCKSYGIRQSADISNKSIMSIIHFDDNDMNNMFKMQRDELQKLQDKELDYKEQIRLLIKENNELKKQ
jgi:hypothetical protein